MPPRWWTRRTSVVFDSISDPYIVENSHARSASWVLTEETAMPC
ncbi:MAG: hypothetical protein R2854_21970 [Caldilineaceae bacterium]